MGLPNEPNDGQHKGLETQVDKEFQAQRQQIEKLREAAERLRLQREDDERRRRYFAEKQAKAAKRKPRTKPRNPQSDYVPLEVNEATLDLAEKKSSHERLVLEAHPDKAPRTAREQHDSGDSPGAGRPSKNRSLALDWKSIHFQTRDYVLQLGKDLPDADRARWFQIIQDFYPRYGEPEPIVRTFEQIRKTFLHHPITKAYVKKILKNKRTDHYRAHRAEQDDMLTHYEAPTEAEKQRKREDPTYVPPKRGANVGNELNIHELGTFSYDEYSGEEHSDHVEGVKDTGGVKSGISELGAVGGMPIKPLRRPTEEKAVEHLEPSKDPMLHYIRRVLAPGIRLPNWMLKAVLEPEIWTNVRFDKQFHRTSSYMGAAKALEQYLYRPVSLHEVRELHEALERAATEYLLGRNIAEDIAKDRIVDLDKIFLETDPEPVPQEKA